MQALTIETTVIFSEAATSIGGDGLDRFLQFIEIASLLQTDLPSLSKLTLRLIFQHNISPYNDLGGLAKELDGTLNRLVDHFKLSHLDIEVERPRESGVAMDDAIKACSQLCSGLFKQNRLNISDYGSQMPRSLSYVFVLLCQCSKQR